MEMEEIFDKLQAVADRYDELNELISDPEVIADSQRFMKLSKEEGSLRETVEKYNQYKKVTQTISDDEELLRETNDDDLTALTKEELAEAREEQAQLEKELEVLLIPKDPNDDKNIIMEIRGAAGGDEARTATVGVMPEAEDVDVDIDPKDIRVDVYRSSGAGGQHVNKTSSAVRMTHLPTGIVVAMQDERSQQQNRAKAMRILKSRVYDYYQQQEQSAYDQKRKDAIGTGDRSERIRTYNYPQNRVTDHRIGLTLNKLDKIMAGDLDEIIEALIVADQTQKLEQLRNE